MRARITTIGWVFFLMIAISWFGSYFIQWSGIQDTMLQNGFGTILLGLPAALYLVFQEKPNREKLRFHWLSWKAVLLLVVIAVALELVTIEINIATSFIFSSYTTDVITEDVSSSSFLVSLLCMAVLPAVFEELSFRGAFFQEYRAAFGSWAGIIFSAFLFGIYHLNMRQFVYAFICGILFSLLIEATDSIASSMFLHFLMNMISCLAIFATLNMPEEANQMAEVAERQYLLMYMLNFFPIAVFGLIILIVSYIGLAKCCGRYEDIKALFSWKNIVSGKRIGSEQQDLQAERLPWYRMFSLPLVISIALCFYVIIAIEIQMGMG